jgi:uridine phosphorylase
MITVFSTGIGTDNIDIVLNELDALANIDFKTRCVKKKLTQLNLIRFETSETLQEAIALDCF